MKHNKRFLLIFLFLLLVPAACSSPEPAKEAPSQPSSPNTPIMSPTNTAPAPIQTLKPSPTQDPLLFRDDFKESLVDGWKWTGENKKTWSLKNKPGWLEIITGAGSVGKGNLNNLLLRQIPQGNFELETKINFQPSGDYQIAGLVIYESGANFIQFGRAFCDAPKACVNDGFYVDMSIDNIYNGGNLGTAAKNSEISFLRLRKEGNKYTAYVSYDGQEWQLIGEKTGEMKPLFVGVMAGQALSAPKPAQFDYFMINQLP